MADKFEVMRFKDIDGGEMSPDNNDGAYWFVYVSDMYDALFAEVKDYLGEVEHAGERPAESVGSNDHDQELRKLLLLEDFAAHLQGVIEYRRKQLQG